VVYPILSFPNPTKPELFCRFHKREIAYFIFHALVYLSLFLEYIDIIRMRKVYGWCLLLLLPAHHLDEFFLSNFAPRKPNFPLLFCQEGKMPGLNFDMFHENVNNSSWIASNAVNTPWIHFTHRYYNNNNNNVIHEQGFVLMFNRIEEQELANLHEKVS
jgi:hypothetical protein